MTPFRDIVLEAIKAAEIDERFLKENFESFIKKSILQFEIDVGSELPEGSVYGKAIYAIANYGEFRERLPKELMDALVDGLSIVLRSRGMNEYLPNHGGTLERYIELVYRSARYNSPIDKSDQRLESEHFARALIRAFPLIIGDFPEDKKILHKVFALSESPQVMPYLYDYMTHDEKLDCVTKAPSLIEYLKPEDITKEIALMAVKHRGALLDFIPLALQDEHIVRAALKSDPVMKHFLTNEQRALLRNRSHNLEI